MLAKRDRAMRPDPSLENFSLEIGAVAKIRSGDLKIAPIAIHIMKEQSGGLGICEPTNNYPAKAADVKDPSVRNGEFVLIGLVHQAFEIAVDVNLGMLSQISGCGIGKAGDAHQE